MSDVKLESAREHIAIIFQDFVHYALSGRQNIGFGRVAEIDDDQRLLDAATRSEIRDALTALPAGFETVLSPQVPDGADLSGGQWQRVALARAFFRDAPLLVLDEPTSALDAIAEQALFDRIRTLAQGRTVVVVSHRFATVRSADRIIVMTEGHISEEGTHDELMARKGHYREMFEAQSAGLFGDAAAQP